MPIVNEYSDVMAIYSKASKLGIALPVFCAEDRETLEAILAAAYEFGKETGCSELPVIPAWTSRYPARGQMKLITAAGDARLGVELMFSDLNVFMGKGSPYRDLLVMPHLDHAFPWLDGDILEDYAGQFASVMCDASEKPFEENIRLTADYVKKIKRKVVVEGAVDEIYEAGSSAEKNSPTTARQAKRFIDETGVDIIVPNVGTEHRSTAEKARYLSDSARAISREVGSILCLHGTSSVSDDDLASLPADGFVKINIYTTLAVSGGQALARHVLRNLGNIFSETAIKEYVEEGVLGSSILSAGGGNAMRPAKPRLEYVTNPLRRDEWFRAVRNRCMEFFDIFNYRRFAV